MKARRQMLRGIRRLKLLILPLPGRGPGRGAVDVGVDRSRLSVLDAHTAETCEECGRTADQEDKHWHVQVKVWQ